MKAYSMDLRERVVAACDDGVDDRAEIAERFRVSESWIRRLLQRRREAGSIGPKPRGGGRRRLRHLGRRPGVEAPGDHSKKKSLRAAEQDRPELKAAREAWRAEFAAVDPARPVFLDETATTTSMTRRHGRAPRGERVDAAVPHGHRKVLTLTAAVRLGGVGGCLVLDGATDAMAFETYAERLLVPGLGPGDIVIMDNLAAHKHAPAEAAIRAAGAEVRFLPAYSPDLDPIEKMSSKVKEALRAAGSRTIDGLIEAIGAALKSVTDRDILGWFRSCGYRYNQ